jgi:anti-sigma factor ChrR (cupin superfamily)
VLPDLLALAKNPDFRWEPMRPGIEMHWLYGDPRSGPSAAVLRYAPGAQLPHHEHTGHEHIFVLEGSQVDARGTYAAPCFVVNPPGTGHDVHSPDGCLVLVIWERPVSFT